MKTSPIQILAADGIDRARQVFGAARAVISDIDGVLLVSGRAVPGAGALLRRRRCALVSNNSTHTARTLRGVFAGAGLAAREQDFFLAGEAAVRAVHESFPGKSVLALASGEVLACARRTLPLAGADETPGVVLVCRDETLTFEKLQRAVNALRAGGGGGACQPRPDASGRRRPRASGDRGNLGVAGSRLPQDSGGSAGCRQALSRSGAAGARTPGRCRT